VLEECRPDSANKKLKISELFYKRAILGVLMKRTYGTAVLFVLLILTVVAITLTDPKDNSGALIPVTTVSNAAR